MTVGHRETMYDILLFIGEEHIVAERMAISLMRRDILTIQLFCRNEIHRSSHPAYGMCLLLALLLITHIRDRFVFLSLILVCQSIHHVNLTLMREDGTHHV